MNVNIVNTNSISDEILGLDLCVKIPVVNQIAGFFERNEWWSIFSACG